MKSMLALAATLASFGNAASANQLDLLLTRMLGTIQVRSEPYMVQGRLSGCQYIFTALAQDWVYRKGEYVKVDGSISIMSMDGKLGSTLKVVVNELQLSQNGAMSLNPSAPSRAYLISKDYGTNLGGLVTRGQSDTPGALFSIFNIDPTLPMLTEAAETNKITIAFNRDSGSSDILLPLELDVVNVNDDGRRMRSTETSVNFANCIVALLREEPR